MINYYLLTAATFAVSIKAITRDARTQVTSIYIDATLGTVSIIGEAFINI